MCGYRDGVVVMLGRSEERGNVIRNYSPIPSSAISDQQSTKPEPTGLL